MNFQNVQIKGKLLLFFLLFSASSGFAQLDSVSVTLGFTHEVNPDSTAMDSIDVMTVAVYVNDMDFLGEIVVTVYDAATNYPIRKVKQTRQELLNDNEITGSVAHMYLYFIEPVAGAYNVVTNVRNYQGANLPPINSTY